MLGATPPRGASMLIIIDKDSDAKEEPLRVEEEENPTVGHGLSKAEFEEKRRIPPAEDRPHFLPSQQVPVDAKDHGNPLGRDGPIAELVPRGRDGSVDHSPPWRLGGIGRTVKVGTTDVPVLRARRIELEFNLRYMSSRVGGDVGSERADRAQAHEVGRSDANHPAGKPSVRVPFLLAWDDEVELLDLGTSVFAYLRSAVGQRT